MTANDILPVLAAVVSLAGAAYSIRLYRTNVREQSEHEQSMKETQR